MTFKETLEIVAHRELNDTELLQFAKDQWGMIVAYLKPEIIAEDKKHNGWTNYETWRVNLELVDGIMWSDEEVTFKDVFELADYIKDSCETMVYDGGKKSLANDYAGAFLSEVNYLEIAKNVAENYLELITGANTQDGEALTN